MSVNVLLIFIDLINNFLLVSCLGDLITRVMVNEQENLKFRVTSGYLNHQSNAASQLELSYYFSCSPLNVYTSFNISSTT